MDDADAPRGTKRRRDRELKKPKRRRGKIPRTTSRNFPSQVDPPRLVANAAEIERILRASHLVWTVVIPRAMPEIGPAAGYHRYRKNAADLEQMLVIGEAFFPLAKLMAAEIAKHFAPERAFVACAKLNCARMMREFESRIPSSLPEDEDNKTAVADAAHDALCGAYSRGHVDMARHIREGFCARHIADGTLADDLRIAKEFGADASAAACASGSIPALADVEIQYPSVVAVPQEDRDAVAARDVGLRCACVRGHIEMVKHLMAPPDARTRITEKSPRRDRRFLLLACRGGHLDVVKYLFQIMCGNEKDACSAADSALDKAFLAGKKDVVEWIARRFAVPAAEFPKRVMRRCRRGAGELFDWMVSEYWGGGTDHPAYSPDERISRRAAFATFLLEWTYERNFHPAVQSVDPVLLERFVDMLEILWDQEINCGDADIAEPRTFLQTIDVLGKCLHDELMPHYWALGRTDLVQRLDDMFRRPKDALPRLVSKYRALLTAGCVQDRPDILDWAQERVGRKLCKWASSRDIPSCADAFVPLREACIVGSRNAVAWLAKKINLVAVGGGGGGGGVSIAFAGESKLNADSPEEEGGEEERRASFGLRMQIPDRALSIVDCGGRELDEEYDTVTVLQHPSTREDSNLDIVLTESIHSICDSETMHLVPYDKRTRLRKLYHPWQASPFVCACAYGRLDLLKDVVALFPRKLVPALRGKCTLISNFISEDAVDPCLKAVLKLECERAFLFACANGHLSVAIWLVETIGAERILRSGGGNIRLRNLASDLARRNGYGGVADFVASLPQF